MKNILITGGAGNIGSALVQALSAQDDCRLFVLDNLYTGKAENVSCLRKDFDHFFCIDVNSDEFYAHPLLQVKFDYVFHYAAVVGVQRTLNDPIAVLRDIDGLKNIFEFARLRSVKRIFFSSSSEVYGESTTFPQKEDETPLNSRLPYSIVKNLGEAYCRSYKKAYGLDYTIFRFFNTYGPCQSEDFVLPRFIKCALAGERIPIFGDGRQTRTFCYIDDNIELSLKCLFEEVGLCETINVGHDRETSVVELARLILMLTGSSSEIVYMPALTEGDMVRRCPDVSKMRNILGRELITLDDGLARTISSIRNSVKC